MYNELMRADVDAIAYRGILYLRLLHSTSVLLNGMQDDYHKLLTVLHMLTISVQFSPSSHDPFFLCDVTQEIQTGASGSQPDP